MLGGVVQVPDVRRPHLSRVDDTSQTLLTGVVVQLRRRFACFELREDGEILRVVRRISGNSHPGGAQGQGITALHRHFIGQTSRSARSLLSRCRRFRRQLTPELTPVGASAAGARGRTTDLLINSRGG
jgi:hypothetical protein